MSILEALKKTKFKNPACKDLVEVLIKHETTFEKKRGSGFVRGIIIGLTDIFPDDTYNIQKVFELERKKVKIPTQIKMKAVDVGPEPHEYGPDGECLTCGNKGNTVTGADGTKKDLQLSDCETLDEIKQYFDEDADRAKQAGEKLGINFGNTKAPEKIFQKILDFLDEPDDE